MGHLAQKTLVKKSVQQFIRAEPNTRFGAFLESGVCMIDIASLEAMFSNIQESTDWNIDGPMLWGYFFTDSSADTLRTLASELDQQGYRFVDMFTPELDDGQDEYYFLHVEKIEPHSVLSPHQRNQELYVLADRFGVDAYDGMDVGPATT